MQLMMYIGNDLIEAVPINVGLISQPGYLGKFKRSLKQKYDFVIKQSGIEPEFLVVNPTPAPVAQKQQAPSFFHVMPNGTLHAPGLVK